MDIKLLNHQYEVLADTTTKVIGLVGGYGNGKTYTLARKAIQLSFLNEGFTGIVTEPTFPMLRDIFIPEMKVALEEWGVKYKFNASSSIFTLYTNGKETKILCMSMENTGRLVGVNAAWVLCDEFDTSKEEIAMNAFIKLLGRLRSGNVRQFVIFTTPEGFKATYRIFVKENDGSRKLIKARTKDNKYLPKDFIEELEKQYPPNLLKAYLDGEFINLSSGTVYSYFDREKHNTNVDAEEHETLHIGQDFNVGGCISTIHVIRYCKIDKIDKVYRVNEVDSDDSFSIGQNIRRLYPNNKKIVIYPDASGKNSKSNAHRSDIQLLLDEKFIIETPKANGRIEDRVNACNGLLSHDRYFINVNNCPKGTEALEQQARDKNGMPEKFTGAGTIDDYNDSYGYFVVRKFPIVKNSFTVTTHKFG